MKTEVFGHIGAGKASLTDAIQYSIGQQEKEIRAAQDIVMHEPFIIRAREFDIEQIKLPMTRRERRAAERKAKKNSK